MLRSANALKAVRSVGTCVALLLLAFSLLVPSSSSAQGITLPSVRVGGPSPEVRKLLLLLEDSRLWYDPKSPDADTQNRYRALEFIRQRYGTAPFDSADLIELGTNPTSARVGAPRRGNRRGPAPVRQ
jgi:hypothetical protein